MYIIFISILRILGIITLLGVRGESTIIKKVPVSSSFGYLILDCVVAPHDKIDVSRQLTKTIDFHFEMYMEMSPTFMEQMYRSPLCS